MTDQTERIAELEAENAYLRGELGLTRDIEELARLRAAFGLSAQQAAVLSVLRKARGGMRTRLQLDEAVPPVQDGVEDRDMKWLDVRISQIRKAMGRDCIETVWGQGYRLTPKGMQAVDEAVAQPFDEAAA